MANIFDITIDSDMATTINVYLRGGIQNTSSSGGTYIDGFNVKKGSGNSAATIEVGDKIAGWIGDVYITGEVTTIPVNDVSDVNPALQGEVL